MTKVECNIIFNDVRRALGVVAERCGLDLEVKPGSYGNGFYRPKVEFKARSIGGVPREQAEFAERAFLYGLKAEDYGRVIQINREDYKVVGFATGRNKYPLHVERVRDGKRVFATYDVIDRIKAPSKLVEVPFGQ